MKSVHVTSCLGKTFERTATTAELKAWARQAQVKEMREVQKFSFTKIGLEIEVHPSRARAIYLKSLLPAGKKHTALNRD